MPARQLVPNADAWRLSPAGFARKIHHLEWPPHLRLLSQVLVLVATGRIPRLLVSLHPGSAKSTAIMRTFPGWVLDIWPSYKIIGASHGDTLAVDHGRFVRDTILANQRILRVRLPAEGNAANDWRTTMGGGMLTAGVGGSITGRRARIGLCDDLVKNYEAAHSTVQREHVWNFFTGDFRNRLYPGAAQVVIGTRWHSLDVIGRIQTEDDDQKWTSLILPAIAEGDEDLDAVLSHHTCERLRREGVDLPTWSRKSGEALWSTTIDQDSGEIVPWYDLEEIESVRKDIGEYKFAALWMQRPTPPQGEMFPISMWDRAQVVPSSTPMVRFWDLAATKDGGDESAGALLCRDKDGYTYVVDVVHGRWSESDVERVMKMTAQKDAEKFGRRVRHIIEQEGGASGKAWARKIIREVLVGFVVEAQSASGTGEKPTRARPLAAQQQAGMVRLVQVLKENGEWGPQPWFDHLEEQARAFPHNSPHDDVIDAVSGAFNRLVGHGSSKVRVSSAAKRRVGVRPL